MPTLHFVAKSSPPRGGRFEFMLAASINREDAVVANDVEQVRALAHCGVLHGGKNPAEDVREFVGADGTRWEVRRPKGVVPRTIEISAGSQKETFPAGGALNAAFVAKALGVDPSAMFVTGPAGPGDGGRFLAENIASQGIHYALFSAGTGSARTLTVHDERGQSTLFSVKATYRVDRREVAYLRDIAARSKVLMALSVKPSDLSLIKGLRASQERGAQMVFSPNAALLKRADLRYEWQELSRQARLSVLNDAEASLLVKHAFARKDIEKVAELLGSEIVVVTMGSLGAMMIEKGGKPVLQPAIAVDAGSRIFTSGAGDTLTMGMSDGLFVLRKSPREALLMGTLAASYKIRSSCPWGGLPSKKDFFDELELMDE